jgi:hypothetical protein
MLTETEYAKEIALIEKEISEKQAHWDKCYEVRVVSGKKNNKKVKPKKRVEAKPHLRKFIEQEIKELEKKKADLLKQKEVLSTYTIVEISWDWVSFDDGYVIITNPDGNYRYNLHILKAKKIFNHIHKRVEAILPPFKIKYYIAMNEIQLIDTLEFSNVIRYLEIKSKLVALPENIVHQDFHDIISHLPNKLESYYFPLHKTTYLEYLCLNQCDEYKIIPLVETRVSNGQITHEDAFLFTIRGKERDVFLIVWENVNISRASFIFPVAKASYENRINEIFQYICNVTSKKRFTLHQTKNIPHELQPFWIVNHTTLGAWIHSLPTP